MFHWPRRSVIGLDVSDRSLEAVLLDRAWGKGVVSAYARIDLPAGVVEDGRILQSAALVENLRDLRQRATPAPIVEHSCLVSLPESQVFSHVYTLPAAVPWAEALRVMLAEAEHFLPLPLGDCYFDVAPLGTGGGKQEILLVATRRSLVHQYLEVFSSAGLLPLAFEPESFSLARALVRGSGMERGGAVLLVDCGARTTNAHVVSRGTVVGSFTIPQAGEHFTEAIASALHCSRQDAEAKKISWGLREPSPDGQKVAVALVSRLQPMAAELARFLAYVRAHRHVTVSQVVLTGGSALVVGLLDFFAAQLRVPATIGNPFLRLRFSRVQLPTTRAPFFGAVVGLALRGIEPHPERRGLNLLAPAYLRLRRDRVQQFLRRPRVSLRLAGLVSVLAAALLALGGLVWYRSNSRAQVGPPPNLEPPPIGFPAGKLLRTHQLRFAFGGDAVIPPGAVPARWLQAAREGRETLAATGTTTVATAMRIIRREDVAAVETMLRGRLQREAQEAMVRQLQAGEMLLPITVPVGLPDFFTDHIAGTVTDSLTATMKLVIGGLAVNRQALELSLREAFGPLEDPVTAVSFAIDRLDLAAKEIFVTIQSSPPPVEK